MRGLSEIEARVLTETADGVWTAEPGGEPATPAEQDAFERLEREGRVRLMMVADGEREWCVASVTVQGRDALAIHRILR